MPAAISSATGPIFSASLRTGTTMDTQGRSVLSDEVTSVADSRASLMWAIAPLRIAVHFEVFQVVHPQLSAMPPTILSLGLPRRTRNYFLLVVRRNSTSGSEFRCC